MLPDLAVMEAGQKPRYVPEGWHTDIPRIVVRDAARFVEFLRRVFEATGEHRSDSPAMMQIGDSVVMVSEAGIRDPMPAFLYVFVEHTDDTYRRALEAGATSLREPAQTPYGDRRSMVRDPWGHTWQIATYSVSRGT